MGHPRGERQPTGICRPCAILRGKGSSLRDQKSRRRRGIEYRGGGSPAISAPHSGYADLLWQILIVTFDAASKFRGVDEVREDDALRQRAEPVFRRLLLVLGPFNERYLFGRLSFSFSSRWAARTRNRANRDVIHELTGRALAPGDRLPRRSWQTQRGILDLDGLVLDIAAQPFRRPSAA